MTGAALLSSAGVPRNQGGTVAGALERTSRRLAAAGVSRPRAEAGVLLGHLLAADRAALLRRSRECLPRGAAAALDALCARRAAGEPVAYLTGVREFWSLELQVDRRVLIPRPESEHLVEAVLELCPTLDPWIADVGTGSGCLALAVASERRTATLIGIDLDAGALSVAAANRQRLGTGSRLHLVRGRGLEAVAGVPGLDAVMSNPPYVPEAEFVGLPTDVRDHEPRLALVAGGDGLAVTREVIAGAARVLRPGGWLALEIHPPSHGKVQSLLPPELWEAPGSRADLNGQVRVVTVRRRGA